MEGYSTGPPPNGIATGTEASSLTPEDSAGGGVGIAVGGAKGEGVGVDCGERVKVGVGEGGIGVTVGCGGEVRVGVGVGEGEMESCVGCGDAVNVRVGEGGAAVCVDRDGLTEQPTTSAMKVRHIVNPIQKSCLPLVITKLAPQGQCRRDY
jgi:hypothetical protein